MLSYYLWYGIVFLCWGFLNPIDFNRVFLYDFIMNAVNENLKERKINLEWTKHWKLTVTSGTLTFSWTSLILQQIFGVFKSKCRLLEQKIIEIIKWMYGQGPKNASKIVTLLVFIIILRDFKLLMGPSALYIVNSS